MLRARLVRDAFVDDVDTLVAFFIAKIHYSSVPHAHMWLRMFIYTVFCHLEHVLIEILRRVYINVVKSLEFANNKSVRYHHDKIHRTVMYWVDLWYP